MLCSIFHNIFKSIQDFTLIFLDFFQYCLKIENNNDVKSRGLNYLLMLVKSVQILVVVLWQHQENHTE